MTENFSQCHRKTQGKPVSGTKCKHMLEILGTL